MKNAEQVILLHGIFDIKWRFTSLERLLKKNGYEVLNIGYPSTKSTIEEHIDYVWQIISKQTDKKRKLHFVGYSMGGLLVRGIINKYKPKNLGRVVQLASPNHGSEIADFLKNNILYKKLFGPAGQQLTTEKKNYDKIFGKVNYELGVIAGDLVLDPLSAWIMGKPSDGRVSVESTKVEGMKDHILVKAGHKYFPHSRRVHNYTLHFLKNGFFKR